MSYEFKVTSSKTISYILFSGADRCFQPHSLSQACSHRSREHASGSAHRRCVDPFATKESDIASVIEKISSFLNPLPTARGSVTVSTFDQHGARAYLAQFARPCAHTFVIFDS